MPQIEFDGQGAPIPTIALPPFGSDSNLPPTVLTFNENADFPVKQYRDLGFTHFEVWCVGAAGGRGGDASQSILFGIEEVMRPVPQDVWNLQRELVALLDLGTQRNDYFNGFGQAPVYNRAYGPGDWRYDHIRPSNAPEGWVGTAADAVEYNNPSHMMKFRTFRQAVLVPTSSQMGGAGGGGGLQKSFGVLTDLDDSVPVVVGKEGADAPYGQVIAPGLFVPDMTGIYRGVNPPISYAGYTGYSLLSTASPDPYLQRQYEIQNYLTSYLNTYPLPQASFGNPQGGQAGGASSFAGDVCQASGGRGGTPAMVWDGAKFVRKGDGGDGGVGGSIEPGGGGLGSKVEGVNGGDGLWRPETGIGGGGGGGKAAGDPKPSGSAIFYPGTGLYQPMTTPLPTAGGQGSYSYADTTVYGQRQFRQSWTYLQPREAPQILDPTGTVALSTGQIVYVPKTDTQNLAIAGGGGGARPAKNLKVGSRATGYSPNGVVVVRLSQISA